MTKPKPIKGKITRTAKPIKNIVEYIQSLDTPNPILTIQEKCRECKGQGSWLIANSPDAIVKCSNCNAKGTQTIKIYNLKDFEKCDYKDIHDEIICYRGQVISLDYYNMLPKDNRLFQFRLFNCKKCNSTGYKIPFKNYEIKKVIEVKPLLVDKELSEFGFNQLILKQFNLKEDDKIVIR